MRVPLLVMTALAVISGARQAIADSMASVRSALVLERGELEVSLTLEANLARRAIGRPLSIAPEAWIGVTPRLTLGLIHGNRSVDQIDPGGSLCIRDCERLHPDAGLDGRYELRRGALAVAARTRLLIRGVEPWKPAVTLGALARWRRGWFAITTDPYLRLGLANRGQGNRAALFVPVWVAIEPTCRWVIALHVGYDSDLAVARDGWHGPLGVVLGVRPHARIELALEAGFRSLLGPQNQFRQRALLLTVAWRQPGLW